ncbi:MAG TPA: gluconate 2-dehydrogenase subunit 3 family protein [Thermomicrobiales bacterium]|nr:gluconate 2-dehydrogenase subunit 3 family protein [Thermomicrobiales bacterium]
MAVHSAYTLDALAQDDPALTGRQFFTSGQAETIEALAEQFWPTTEDSPGGRDAGVMYYIDNALAGAYQEYKEVYRTGIDWLDDAAQREYGSVFRQLSSEDQTALITAIFEADDEEQAAPGLATPEQIEVEGIPLVDVTPVVVEPEPEGTGRTQVAGLQAPTIASLPEFMSLVLTHTMEGLFSDPVYGGNRDFAGWRAVGYPGAHYLYTEEEQQSFEPLNKPIQSLADL